MIRRPENKWTATPERVMPFAAFMHTAGLLAVPPDDWKQLFFPDISELAGS